MKHLITLSIALLITSCANYSDRGPEGGNQKVTSTGYAVSCNAEPRNQPGCYQKTGSSWSLGKLKFSLGN